jgi:hypothetical protein
MKLKKVLPLGLAIGCMVFGLLAGSVSAQDYYIEKSIETLVDGKPMDSGSFLLKTWVKNDQVRYFNERDKDNVLIIHMGQDKAYQVNETKKTVKEVDLKKQFAALEKEIQVSSKKTGKTKKVDQWDTYQVILTCSAKGISTEMEYWLTDAIKVPEEIRSKMAGYLGQKKIVEELNKYAGYPVEIDAHMDNKKVMVTRLVKLEKKALDRKLFEIPRDYKKEGEPEGVTSKTPKPQDGEKKGGTAGQSPAGATEKESPVQGKKHRR